MPASAHEVSASPENTNFAVRWIVSELSLLQQAVQFAATRT
jgi:hypothetical protein